MATVTFTTRANLVAGNPENIGDVTDCLDKLLAGVNSVDSTQVAAQQAWQTLTGVGVSNLSYFKDTLGRVHIEATSVVVGGSSISPGTTLGTLPVGYRPRVILAFPLYRAGGVGTVFAWNVSSAGVVSCPAALSAGESLVFMGGSFRAEN